MTMLIPNNWSKITLAQYQELKALEAEEESIGSFEYIIEQLAILLDTDSEDDFFDDMDIDQLLEMIKNVSWLRSKPNGMIKNEIDKYYCKELNKLTLGEFLDLEHYFKEDYFANLHYIAAILYRRRKTDEWDNIIEEPYIYDPKQRADKYLDLPITYTFGLIQYYTEWKENIMKIYENVFEEPGFDEINEEDELTGQELAEHRKQIAQDKAKSEWSWEAIIYDLSNKDLTKYDQLFDTTFILVMNTLSMKKLFDF